ncbi:hypothetical protein OS493_015135 [Desmophyllum pertusum]|uniref:G-protein coupled receptors family 2 profile 2 domain-containing protein n=1 Tax=Desmophyllum pertusum TaxID=174260 RepID=A0A9X0D362_9CNID|nr:hypothetical protein OS493_015135 [Desmophyllum pertusum]
MWKVDQSLIYLFGIFRHIFFLKTNELTNQQIKDILKANNCTSIKFEEGKEVVVYNEDVSKESLKHTDIQSNMELVLICISIAAVVLALILLTALKLKSSEKLFIHKSLLLSLGLGNLVFVLDKNLFTTRQDHVALCSAVTVIQFYLHTALFTWMLVEGINLYIKLIKVFSVKKQYVAYVAMGWGLPAVIVGLVAAIRPSTFDMGKTSAYRCNVWSTKIHCRDRTNQANVVLFCDYSPRDLWENSYKVRQRSRATHEERSEKALSLFSPCWVSRGCWAFLSSFILLWDMFLSCSTLHRELCFSSFIVFSMTRFKMLFGSWFVKTHADFKTRSTPADSNPNTTPDMERHSRVNMMQKATQDSGKCGAVCDYSPRDLGKIATKRGLRSIVASSPLAGCHVVVGFFVEFHLALGYVFILLNSTQGVVFFIFHCVLDDQVQDAIRKLAVKTHVDFKTRSTPADSNPNTTPDMERHSRVNMMQKATQDSEDDKSTSNETTKNGAKAY